MILRFIFVSLTAINIIYSERNIERKYFGMHEEFFSGLKSSEAILSFRTKCCPKKNCLHIVLEH